MRLGWLVSPVLHVAAVGATLIAWTNAPPDMKPPSAAVPIDVVDISELSNIKPIAAQAEPLETLAPEAVQGAPQELAEMAPTPSFKPTPEPTPQKPAKPRDSLNLDDLAQMLDRSKPAGARQTQQTQGVKGEQPRRAVGAGDGLTVTEEDAIRAQMRECWRMPIDMATPEKLIVKVRVSFEANGALIGPPEVVSPSNFRSGDPATRAAAEAAVRAVRLCNPLRVNPNRRAGGEVTLNFDPREMIAP